MHVNHLPYMPFPPNWPVFIPKDKLANWFEAYVESLELNLWTGTALAGGSSHDRGRRDGGASRCRREDGTERVMRPRPILVYATGVSSIPRSPQLPGPGRVPRRGDAFGGVHDRRGVAGAQGAGARHRQQRPRRRPGPLHASGAAVSLIQRSPTYIVSIREAQSVYPPSIPRGCRPTTATCWRPRCLIRS